MCIISILLGLEAEIPFPIESPAIVTAAQESVYLSGSPAAPILPPFLHNAQQSIVLIFLGLPPAFGLWMKFH